MIFFIRTKYNNLLRIIHMYIPKEVGMKVNYLTFLETWETPNDQILGR